MPRKLSGAALQARDRRLFREAAEHEINQAVTAIRRRDAFAISRTLFHIQRADILQERAL